MKNKIKTPPAKYNPVLIQINSMKSHYPNFKHHYDKEGNLFFVGVVQPSLTMPIYTISVEYRKNLMPKVKIVEPLLVEKPPHYYYKQGCLCLYKPANFNWTATKPISTYIVSWTTCWLYFYEVWKEKQEWLGPEAEHNQINKE